MASSGILSLACVVLISMVLVAPHAEAAVTCGQVTSSLSPCLPYLKGAGPLQPGCCNGIRSLNSAAKTTPDRQAACRCLKQAASSISGINLGLASGLPGKCGMSIPYKISPSTNCNSVK
ncbi:hypothetical protein L1049_009383 [Liquidambar formosana]|uniref:Non-specific lipid-transfer protein n=1 Tax=Liquidambar formosana TaxID=63359 RepID=A0AAP0S599_LIQFO